MSDPFVYAFTETRFVSEDTYDLDNLDHLPVYPHITITVSQAGRRVLQISPYDSWGFISELKKDPTLESYVWESSHGKSGFVLNKDSLGVHWFTAISDGNGLGTHDTWTPYDPSFTDLLADIAKVEAR
jgi:hypothetical protein